MTSSEFGESLEFALIVVNYGSSKLLAQNLVDMDLGKHRGCIIVVDNFMSNNERQNVRRLAATENWIVLELDDNLGFGAGVNVGARHAFDNGMVSMAVLNPDAKISTEDLLKLVRATREDPNLMVSPIIRTSSGSLWFAGMDLYTDTGRVASRRRRDLPTGPHEPWLTGACFAISRYLWERVGGFDEDYFLYWEDVDLSRRVIAQEGRLAVLEDAAAVHDEGGTQDIVGKKGTKSEIYYFYNIRNRLVYAAKHMHDDDLKAWMWATPVVSYEILLGGGRRQFLYTLAPLRAYFKGMFLGWRMMKNIQTLETGNSDAISQIGKGEESCS